MNILATQYTLVTKSFEIYLAGCNGQPKCKGCHNPDSWCFNNGEKCNATLLEQIKVKIQAFDNLIKNIMIFGGEPLDQQHEELEMLLCSLTDLNIPIWIFTRYPIEKVPLFIKEYCTYIKCGRYLEEFKTDNNVQYGVKLATSNQYIYKKGIDY